MARKKKSQGEAAKGGESPAALLKSAEEWAIECGLRGPLSLSGPEKVPYPQFGYGYMILVTEKTPHKPGAKIRMGTARFTDKGQRVMWTIDGSVVL